uniref:Uncharacterized protein n=1 Tax=Siphoviridae sp. ctgN495 TaxID=2825608 RepID=A0A8S5UCR2_9CAUD|nr:MAG TPA: hypothetical protein [Siphoviridae sp. ctgN495]
MIKSYSFFFDFFHIHKQQLTLFFNFVFAPKTQPLIILNAQLFSSILLYLIEIRKSIEF